MYFQRPINILVLHQLVDERPEITRVPHAEQALVERTKSPDVEHNDSKKKHAGGVLRRLTKA